MGDTVSLTGKDSTILDDRIMQYLADADTVNLEFPNDLVAVKVGKGGNAIYAFNGTGKQANATIRVMRGSADDKYLNSRMLEQINDLAAFVLFKGEFVKRVGDGAGNVVSDIYKLEGGVIQKIPTTKENVEGDTDQSITTYVINFANTDRSLS